MYFKRISNKIVLYKTTRNFTDIWGSRLRFLLRIYLNLHFKKKLHIFVILGGKYSINWLKNICLKQHLFLVSKCMFCDRFFQSLNLHEKYKFAMSFLESVRLSTKMSDLQSDGRINSSDTQSNLCCHWKHIWRILQTHTPSMDAYVEK